MFYGLTTNDLEKIVATLAEKQDRRERLVELISTRLLGVRPEEQDVVLEDADWREMLAALRGE